MEHTPAIHCLMAAIEDLADKEQFLRTFPSVDQRSETKTHRWCANSKAINLRIESLTKKRRLARVSPFLKQ